MYGFHFLLKTVGVGYVHDTQCGFKVCPSLVYLLCAVLNVSFQLFTNKSAYALFDSLHILGWIFDVELLLLAQRFDIPVSEVSIQWHEVDGSKLNVARDSAIMLRDVLVLRANYTLRRWKPSKLLSGKSD
jgi:dolichyl-phosphate beta-glucosyltransferase